MINPKGVIPSTVVAHILFDLHLPNDIRRTKRALQDLCELYEKGYRLENPVVFQHSLHSYLHHPTEVVLRRWAIKALGLIGDRGDATRIIERLRQENDTEARLWGMAALLKTQSHRSAADIRKDAGIEKFKALDLASLLYSSDSWIARYAEPVTVNLSDDDLTLQWALYLLGYQRAPDNLFSPKHDNVIFLGELNTHPNPEIAERSVWAIWERQDASSRNLKIADSAFHAAPDNVRKWLYRVALQGSQTTSLDPDVLSEWSRDKSPSVLEGLAMGVADLSGDQYDAPLLDWYGNEKEERVKNFLLSSLASRKTNSRAIIELLSLRFSMEDVRSPFRSRLLHLSSNNPSTSRALKKIAAQDLRDRSYRQPQQLIFVEGDNNMNSYKFENTGNITNSNIVAGDMVNSANTAIAELDKRSHQDAELLREVIALLQSSEANDIQKSELAETIKSAADNPTKGARSTLLEKLRSVRDSVEASGTIAENLGKIIAIVSPWVGMATS